jgi:bifunctional DNA-binding transcriptional regulator/antitoxin component of YhaV-PrlF toxin-antitoxin module
MITRLTGKNQVTVPAEIARKEGMRAGTRLDWRLTDRPHVLEVHVLPDPATLAAQLRGGGKKRRRMPGIAVERLVEEWRVEEGLE